MRFIKRVMAGFGVAGVVGVILIAVAVRPAIDVVTLPPAGIRHFADLTTPVPASPRQSLRIITYNMGYAFGDKNNTGEQLTEADVRRNLDTMVAALNELHPDILGLQEVDFAAARTHHIDQLAYLARGLRMPFAAYVVTWNHRYVPWPYWPPSRHFGQVVSGQAVLSRTPILAHATHTFAKPAANPFWYNLFYLDRIAQRVTIHAGPQPMVLWHVHLEAFDDATRGAQLRTLAELIRADGEPLLFVAGDFNADSHSPPLIDFGRTLQLHNAELPEMTYSYASFAPESKIDHIFHRAVAPLHTAGTLTTLRASDHIPVWGEFATPLH